MMSSALAFPPRENGNAVYIDDIITKKAPAQIPWKSFAYEK